MKILFLTDNFPPESNAPALRTYEHAKVWVREGHDVTVVTCAPNFPTGRVHEGYRNRPYAVERMDGIRVVRVWTYITANTGRFRRSLDYASFMLSSVPGALVQERPDVVVGTSPQLLTAAAASAVARLRRVPFVFELRDLWPESIAAVGVLRGGPAIRLLARLADGLYRRADGIVSVTESFVDVLEQRGIPRKKVVVVRNAVNLAEFSTGPGDAGFREKAGIGGDRFLATYVGTLGMAHALTTVLDCAEITRDEPIHYLLVGEGAEQEGLEAEAGRRGLDNVTFLGRQPRGRVPAILSSSDAVLVHLKDDPLFNTVIPSKIFEAMAVGKPIVLGVRGESAEIVAGAGAGIVVKPEFPVEMAAALRRLRADPALGAELGANGRAAAESEFCRRAAALRMLAALEDVVSARRG